MAERFTEWWPGRQKEAGHRPGRRHSVNDGPSDPDTLEPVPCLIGFMLVIGNFGSNHSNGRHQAGQHGADPGNLVIDIDDDTVCGRPHILYGQSWRNHIVTIKINAII